MRKTDNFDSVNNHLDEYHKRTSLIVTAGWFSTIGRFLIYTGLFLILLAIAYYFYKKAIQQPTIIIDQKVAERIHKNNAILYAEQTAQLKKHISESTKPVTPEQLNQIITEMTSKMGEQNEKSLDELNKKVEQKMDEQKQQIEQKIEEQSQKNEQQFKKLATNLNEKIAEKMKQEKNGVIYNYSVLAKKEINQGGFKYVYTQWNFKTSENDTPSTQSCWMKKGDITYDLAYKNENGKITNDKNPNRYNDDNGWNKDLENKAREYCVWQ